MNNVEKEKKDVTDLINNCYLFIYFFKFSGMKIEGEEEEGLVTDAGRGTHNRNTIDHIQTTTTLTATATTTTLTMDHFIITQIYVSGINVKINATCHLQTSIADTEGASVRPIVRTSRTAFVCASDYDDRTQFHMFDQKNEHG